MKKNGVLTTIFVVQLFLFLLLKTFSLASDRFSRFPGLSEVLSPDGQYVLRNVDIEKNGEFNHQLILRDTKTNTEKVIYPYGRRVDVLWSEDSKGLIINDHGGSDYTNCIIFQCKKGIKKRDVRALLTSQTIKYKKSIVGNHHVYIEGVRWMTNRTIKIRITGYGEVDPDGFSMWFTYTIGSKFKFITKKSQDSPEP